MATAKPTAAQGKPAPGVNPTTQRLTRVGLIIGAAVAIGLADTKAAPLVIAALTAAIVFQVLNL